MVITARSDRHELEEEVDTREKALGNKLGVFFQCNH